MNKAFEKILERLDNGVSLPKMNGMERRVGKRQTQGFGFGVRFAKQIVQEVAEEYNVDMKHNLAEMYAKNMVDYGVDVTEAWQTAMQQSCALEKAYIRGRQYEVDRFNELRKEYKGGWIPCSERLPEEIDWYLAVFEEVDTGFIGLPYIADYLMGKHTIYTTEDGWIIHNCTDREEESAEYYKNLRCVAWQPLPEPFKERD